jgi:NADH:ubiquinone reductase (H+-translocating)
VWCAGLQAPPVIAGLPGPHGRGGRLRVDDHLEVVDRPGVFGAGDVVELVDPRTKRPVPGTAQAAIAEAKVAAHNILARYTGGRPRSFTFEERAMLVSVGVGQAAGTLGRVTLWSRPAAVLKALVEREYSEARQHGRRPVNG